MSIKIGLDVGGVIVESMKSNDTDTSFRGDNFMATPAVEGAFDATRQLVAEFGPANVFIISKCGSVIEAKTREWLHGNGFYTTTGFDPAHLYFCVTRPEKAPKAKLLGLTDFVDDHPQVLKFMQGIVARRYLFGSQPEGRNTTGLIVGPTWSVTLKEIMRHAA